MNSITQNKLKILSFSWRTNEELGYEMDMEEGRAFGFSSIFELFRIPMKKGASHSQCYGDNWTSKYLQLYKILISLNKIEIIIIN